MNSTFRNNLKASTRRATATLLRDRKVTGLQARPPPLQRSSIADELNSHLSFEACTP